MTRWKKSWMWMILWGSLCLFMFLPAHAEESAKTYRIGYIEGGPYWVFASTLDAVKKSLENKGEWEKLNWKGKAVFPEDAVYSPGWDKEAELYKDAERIMARKDLDLIIVAGTTATDAVLKANNGTTPILSIAVTDAVKSKFVINENDSGVNNFTVRIVPGRYKRMFQIFHDVVGFKKLGLLYPNTEDGKKYSNVEDARAVAKERGFELVEYNKFDRTEKTEDCLNGIQVLIDNKIDAFFIPPFTCFDWQQSDVKLLLDMLTKQKIPTFAREGTKMVKSGALMGFSTIDFSKRGRFLAERVIRLLHGEQARKLPMVDNAIPKISLNLHVAELIGFDPSFDIIAASDEIFQEIVLPSNRLVK